MNLTKKRKVYLGAALTIVLLFCLLILFVNNKKNDLNTAAIKNADAILKNKSEIKSDYIIYSKGIIEKTPLINHKYNLNGKNNEKYYNMLNYGVVKDRFDQTGLNVITAHDYSFFNKLHLIKFDDIIEIKNNKTSEIDKYKVFKTLTIDKGEGSMIYNSNLNSKKDLVLSTCVSNTFEGFEPSKRFVVYAEKLD